MRNKSKEDKSIKNKGKQRVNLLYDRNYIFIASIWKNTLRSSRIVKKISERSED